MSFADLVAATDRIAQSHLGGTSVLYRPEFGNWVTVHGIFDTNHPLAERPEAGVDENDPSVWLLLADLPVDPVQDNPILTIAGTQYKVRFSQPDGLGGIRLFLYRVS